MKASMWMNCVYRCHMGGFRRRPFRLLSRIQTTVINSHSTLDCQSLVIYSPPRSVYSFQSVLPVFPLQYFVFPSHLPLFVLTLPTLHLIKLPPHLLYHARTHRQMAWWKDLVVHHTHMKDMCSTVAVTFDVEHYSVAPNHAHGLFEFLLCTEQIKIKLIDSLLIVFLLYWFSFPSVLSVTLSYYGAWLILSRREKLIHLSVFLSLIQEHFCRDIEKRRWRGKRK